MSTATKSKVSRARLRAYPVLANPVGVDEENKVIRGYVVAEVGPFKSGRGQFTHESLEAIVGLMLANPEGTKVRYGHPDGTSEQALDSFIGWDKNPRIDGGKVRADLHLSPVAFLPPKNGGISRGEYLLTRAKLEPASLSSSLALDADEMFLSSQEPPIWTPTVIWASDIVDDGDAVHGAFLSAEDAVAALPAMLDEAFAGQPKETVQAFFDSYLASRYPEQIADVPAVIPAVEAVVATPETLRAKIKAMSAQELSAVRQYLHEQDLRRKHRNQMLKAGKLGK